MKKLTFYYQKRRDGGLRTGVEVNDEGVLEKFEPGREPEDSRLLWFIDLRCTGKRLPTQPEAIRVWLLENGNKVRDTLGKMAEDVLAGIDSDWPVKKDVLGPPGTEMAIYCSAMRRLDGREIAKVISTLREHWGEIIEKLSSCEQTVH